MSTGLAVLLGGRLGGLRARLLAPVLAVLVAGLLCAVALLVSGASPWLALRTMVAQVGQGSTAVDIVNSAAVYYLSGLAVALGFQMKLFNIGVEGQYRLAACVAAVVGGRWVLPPVLHTVVIIVVAVLVGAGWASIAALLRAYRGVSEVISTIMLNAVSTGLIAYLIRPDTFGVLRGNNITTAPIAPSGRVPGIPVGADTTVFGLVLLAVALGLGYWFLLARTRFGFELKASGESPTAAEAGGVRADPGSGDNRGGGRRAAAGRGGGRPRRAARAARARLCLHAGLSAGLRVHRRRDRAAGPQQPGRHRGGVAAVGVPGQVRAGTGQRGRA